MSEDNGTPMSTLSVVVKSNFESDDDALEILVQLRDLEFGGLFTERDTNLDTEEDEGVSIHFSNPEQRVYLDLSIGEESELRVSLSLSDDTISQITEVLNPVVEHLDHVKLEHIHYNKKFEAEFDTYNVPIKEDTKHNVIGVRFRESGMEFILQEWEEEKSMVSAWKDVESEIDEEISTYATRFKDQVIEHIEEEF